jgi:NhaC family Na+:H+ antiporter
VDVLSETNPRAIRPVGAVLAVLIVLAVIITGIFLQGGMTRSPLPLLAGVAVLAGVGAWRGLPGADFQAAIMRGMSGVGIAVFVLLLVGALVGAWIGGGIIPTLIVYGLDLISPSLFLPTAFLVCVFTSVVTGTSFGTIGTVGVALIGIAAALGIPLPLSAGAIIGGAYFGDKMSPVSDTTNIAAAMGGIDLFRHIRSMLYTTVPAAILCVIFYWLANRGPSTADLGRIGDMQDALRDQWHIHWFHFLPFLVMLALAVRRTPALLMLGAGVVMGVVWGMLFQDESAVAVTGFMVSGYENSDAMSGIGEILNRGGMQSTFNVIMIIIAAGALGGAFQAVGLFNTIYGAFFSNRKSPRGLVLSQVAFCYGIIISTGSMALSLVLPGQLFRPAYRRSGVDPAVMTRTLEDVGTITAPLIPWAGAAVFASRMLGVPVLDFAPYVWFAFLVPLFSVTYAVTGFAIWKEEPGQEPET